MSTRMSTPMTHKDIQALFDRKPAIKIGDFLKEAGLTFNDWYAIKRGREITDEQANKIQQVMFRYGG